VKPAEILRTERAAELEKKGVKDFQLDYAIKTLKRLAAPAYIASADVPKKTR
jgi:carboxyl-terminal processing protease